MASIRIIMRRCMGIGKKEASIADLLACYIFDCPKSSRLCLNMKHLIYIFAEAKVFYKQLI